MGKLVWLVLVSSVVERLMISEATQAFVIFSTLLTAKALH